MKRHLSIVLIGLLAAGCTEPEAVEEPSQYIAVRRAWAPGERAATIQQIEQTGALAFVSAYASTIYSDPDSVVTLVQNPEWTPPAAHSTTSLALHLANRFAVTWNVAGVRLEAYNDSQVPSDTTVWTGIFYYDPADTGNRGYIIRGGTSTTFGRTNVNTTAFEASGNKTGAGGGEVHLGTGSEWTAGGPVIPQRNTIEVLLQTYGAQTSITSGPWLGGLEASGTMQGRAKRVVFNRVAGTDLPLTFEVDIDFRGGIQSMQIVCNFPNPCTSSALSIRN